jgi:plasmid maintenance system killer protein
LEIAFDTKSLRQICENEDKAKEQLGTKVAGRLKRRLADLRAAASVVDLIAGRPHVLEGAHNRYFVVGLAGGYRMVFTANHARIPMLSSGVVDWAKVSRIKILRIESVHDQN